jgi:dynein heavy chain
MARDGRETQWRSLCESEIPENVTLPDKLDEVLNPIQRFCIIRAVRGDRILQQALSFVSTVLGKSYIASSQLDFESLLAESSAIKPIILLYEEESETVRRFFVNFAKTKVGNSYTIVDVHSLGLNDDKQIKRLMSKSIEEGTWLLLRNFHNSPNILNQIEAIINENANQKLLNHNFRCWISSRLTQKKPSSIILNSIRLFINQPETMKENIMRSFSWVDSDQVKLSNKHEWPILLHNIIYFHSCLRLRSRYYRCGWNSPSSLNFTTEEFLVKKLDHFFDSV